MRFDIKRVSRWNIPFLVAVAVIGSRNPLWRPGSRTRPWNSSFPREQGAGADQMARSSRVRRQAQADEAAHGRHQQGGRRGREGFLDVKESKGDAHKLIITFCRTLFTTPACDAHSRSHWRDLNAGTDDGASDNFVLWVNAGNSVQSPKEYRRRGESGRRQVHPEHEVVERHHLYRRQVAPPV